MLVDKKKKTHSAVLRGHVRGKRRAECGCRGVVEIRQGGEGVLNSVMNG